MAVQIQFPRASGPASLTAHADRGDGTPRRGQPPRDWTDPTTGVRYTSAYVVVQGRVTCGKCLAQ